MQQTNLQTRPRDLSAHMVRLWGKQGYLHISGAGFTQDTEYAWSGMPSQAYEMRTKWQNKGRDWPFGMVPMRRAK